MLKKPLIWMAGAVLLSVGCNKNSEPAIDSEETVSESVNLRRHCGANEVLEEQMKQDPGLRGRMDAIEEHLRRVQENPSAYRLLGNGDIEIPVVVNVLYKTTAQNISDAQIASQITVLNADFAGSNADVGLTPSTFTGVLAGDVKVRFKLEGVVRKKTNKTSWQLNDAMKKSTQGGINPTSPSTTLNIWVCNLTSGYLGYAQFPGGALATDGVVIDDNAFGTSGTATAPFNKGRTATHEVGHWLNLRHIWGDATCGNDFVSDTPLHNGPNYGCPAAGHKSTCTGTPVEMTMNYMDYTDDACMYMFSAGQKSRMLGVFAAGGPRNSFAQP